MLLVLPQVEHHITPDSVVEVETKIYDNVGDVIRVTGVSVLSLMLAYNDLYQNY